MKESFVFLADGFEDIEALSPIDVLRRAGIPVTTVSINGTKSASSAHGVKVEADIAFDASLLRDAEWLILPGGMPGSVNLYNHKALCSLLKEHDAKGGRIAAICAAPAIVLGQLGLLEGLKATCYPGMEGYCRDAAMEDAGVVADRNIVTGAGPAFALPWSYKIVEETLGKDKADEIASAMLFNR